LDTNSEHEPPFSGTAKETNPILETPKNLTPDEFVLAVLPCLQAVLTDESILVTRTDCEDPYFILEGVLEGNQEKAQGVRRYIIRNQSIDPQQIGVAGSLALRQRLWLAVAPDAGLIRPQLPPLIALEKIKPTLDIHSSADLLLSSLRESAKSDKVVERIEHLHRTQNGPFRIYSS